MCLFDEIEAAVRDKAREVAERELHARERATWLYTSPNGVAMHGMSAEYDPEMRKQYIDNKEREAIELLKRSIIESIVLED